MSFYALSTDTVVSYIKSRPKMKDYFDKDNEIIASEIGDGNLNQVFIVSNNYKSLILKQALPYLRVAGESWPLTLDRMRYETQALLLHQELAPGLVPKIFDHNEEMALLIMENLEKHEVMRKPLVNRKHFPQFADHISTFLARTLFFTSDLYLTGPKKKELQAKFINPDLCQMQEEFVFTNPFMDSNDNNWNPLIDKEVKEVRSNSKLKIAIAEIKEMYMTHAQAIIHSDLHTGSIMLNEKDTRVIDPEFGFCGPMGFDIGALIENIILNYVSHFAHTPNKVVREDYQEYLLDTVKDIWNFFAKKFDALWEGNADGDLMPKKYWDYPGGSEAFEEFRKTYILKLLQDTAAFGGCKMLRRMMGIVSVWDITSIEDDEKRAFCERIIIKIGKRWILEHKDISSIEDLISIVKEEAKK